MAVTIESADDRPPNAQMDSVEQYTREQALQSEQDVLEGLRALERAEGVQWYIYRMNSADQSRDGFLDKWGTSFLTQENLRDKFGPGTYKVRGHYPNGVIAAHRTVSIAGDAPVRAPTVATAEKPAGDLASILLAMETRDERRRSEERAHREDDRAFWKNLAATLAPIVAPKIIDLVTGNRGGGVTELLTGLKELRALEGGGGNNGLKGTLETIALLRDTFGESGSRAGEKGPWDALTELAKHAGPKIGAVLEALPQAVQNAKPAMLPIARPVMRVISSPAPNSVPAGGVNPSAAVVTDSPSASDVADASAMHVSTNSDDPNSNDPEAILSPDSQTNLTPQNGEGSDMNIAALKLIPWLRKQLEFLLLKATRNSDASLYADLALDNLPDGVKGQDLLQFLERDDWWIVLQHFDERVAPYQGWFQQFRDAAIETIHES